MRESRNPDRLHAGIPQTLTDYMRESRKPRQLSEEAREATTERPLTITNKVGLHARPAALFVQTAARFKDTKIEVVKDGTVRDAKSMLGVLTLGVSQGTTITVRADGPHADEAIAALTDLVDRDFGE
jgi:phosphocarrier protein